MLPIRLKIKAINSFKNEQDINFDELNSGFFGIFGPTGSGKSTILDSLMLALYGKTPRAKNAYDFISLGKNTSEVSFEFEASQRVYLIERTFKRKKDGKNESTACLYKKENGSFNVVSEGVISVDFEIKKLLGMGFEEFSKVIALPQGQFANFLKATSSERTNLISNLFNLQEYGDALTISVKQKEKNKEMELAQTNGQLMALDGVNDEKLQEIVNLIDAKKQISLKLESDFETLSEQLKNLEILNLKNEELTKANAKLNELELKKEKIAEQKRQIEKIELSIPLAKDVEELAKINQECSNLGEKIAQLRIKFNNVCFSYDSLKEEVSLIISSFEHDYQTLLNTKNKACELIKKESDQKRFKELLSSFLSEEKELNGQINQIKEQTQLLIKTLNTLSSELDKNKVYLNEVSVDPMVSEQIKKGVDLASQIEIIDTFAADLTTIKFDLNKSLNENSHKIESAQESEIEIENCRGFVRCANIVEEKLSAEISKMFELKGQRKMVVDSLEKRFGGQNIFYIKNAIEKSEATQNSVKNKISELEKQIGQATVETNVNKTKLADLEIKLENLNAKKAELTQKIADFEKESFDLTSGQALEEFLNQTTEKIESLTSTKQEKERQLNLLFNERASLEAEMKQGLVELNAKNALRLTKQEGFNQNLSKVGLAQEEVLTFKEQEPYLDSLKASVDEFETLIKLNSGLKERLELELDGKIDELSKFEQTKLAKQNLGEQIRELNTQIGVLESERKRNIVELERKKALTQLQAKEQKELDLIKELSKLLKGKALAEFISQIYLKNITERANMIAQNLLDGEFTLNYLKGEFFVLDNLNNQEARAVSTLSGGETFLISLSLSLAISEAISNQANKHIDFFFLDEGFGSLDNDLCETVVSALYKLQNNNLKIGVISHVDLLKEKINNKILVDKNADGASTVKLDVSI